MYQFSSELHRVNVGHAEMLKGGVIMDVTNVEQAKIAEDAGAEAVMALERVPEAKNLGAPLELVEWVAQHGRLPVPNFSAGGIATPADAALVMQLGAEAVFVGSGIFKSSDPAARANAIVKAAKNYNNPEKLLEASRALGEAMP